MIILQRWEPTISDTFPSKIPFWIDVQGLPKHYWQPEMLKAIGKDIGEFLSMEISNTSAKIRILIDGLQPLVFDTMVDFPDGSEALIILDYKNLKSFCSHCKRLTHEKRFCPGLSGESEAISHSKPSEPLSAPQEVSRNYYTPKDNFAAPRDKNIRPSNSAVSREASSIHEREINTWKERHNPQNPAQDPLERRYHSGESRSRRFHSTSDRFDASRRTPTKRYSARSQDFNKDTARRSYPRRENSNKSYYQWQEKSKTSVSPRHYGSDSSKSRRPPLERTFSPAEVTPPPPPPIPTNEEIMGDLRDVTLQYISCADPTESAARKRRVIQGEERGLMAETASHMLEAAISTSHAFLAIESGSQAALDAAPPKFDPPSTSLIPTKKKRGRPPIIKPQSKAPVPLLGAKSSKRNKSLIQNSPKRKNTPERSTTQKQPGTERGRKSKAKQQLILQCGEPSNPPGQDAPRINLIPARSKAKMDFHNPSAQLP